GFTMSRTSILITGSNGQVGRELRQLAHHYPHLNFIFLSRKELPFEDERALSDAIEKNQPHFCINCAAYTAVDKAEEDKKLAYVINEEAVGVLASSCHKYNCCLIHISTDYFFDCLFGMPY